MHLCSITSNLEKAAKDWRAGCAERCTSGSGRGGEKRTGLETSRNVSWQVKSMKQHRAGRLLYAGTQTRTREGPYKTSLLEIGRRKSFLTSKQKVSREGCQVIGREVRIIHHRKTLYRPLLRRSSRTRLLGPSRQSLPVLALGASVAK